MTTLICRDFLEATEKTVNVHDSLSDGQVQELPPFVPASGGDAIGGIDAGALEHFREAGLRIPAPNPKRRRRQRRSAALRNLY